MRIKRTTKVEYTYAAGKKVQGTVVKQHQATEWYVVRLTDEEGTYSGSCHIDQLRVVDNRPNRTVP